MGASLSRRNEAGSIPVMSAIIRNAMKNLTVEYAFSESSASYVFLGWIVFRW